MKVKTMANVVANIHRSIMDDIRNGKLVEVCNLKANQYSTNFKVNSVFMKIMHLAFPTFEICLQQDPKGKIYRVKIYAEKGITEEFRHDCEIAIKALAKVVA